MTFESTNEALLASATDVTATWNSTAFSPGGDVGLVARDTIALVARDNASTRERLWQLVSVDAPLGDVLDELSRVGISRLPDFALAQSEGELVRLVARGRMTVEITGTDGSTRSLDPSNVRTWLEEAVADVASVELSLPVASGADADQAAAGLNAEGGFFVLAGSVPASSLTREFDAGRPVPAARAASDTAESEPGRIESATTVPDAGSATADGGDVGSDDAIGMNAAAHGGHDDVRADRSAGADSANSRAGTDQADDSANARAGADRADEADEADQADQAEGAGQDPSASDIGLDAGVDGEVDRDRGGDDAEAADPSEPDIGLNAGLVGDADPEPGGADDGATDPSDSDIGLNAAVDGDAVREVGGVDEAAASGDGDGRPTVHAVLAFANGERIPVDRTVLVGRNPKIAGVVDTELPRIMKYEGKGLSRTHAEIRVEDGQLVLEDLDSTNGTEVEAPGAERETLDPATPVVITIGTSIIFGDQLICDVEAPTPS